MAAAQRGLDRRLPNRHPRADANRVLRIVRGG